MLQVYGYSFVTLSKPIICFFVSSVTIRWLVEMTIMTQLLPSQVQYYASTKYKLLQNAWANKLYYTALH